MANDTKIEQTNQLMRAYCVWILLTGFVITFIYGQVRGTPIISTDAFVGVLSTAMVWLFKSRDEEKTQKAVADATAAALTPPPTKNGETNAPVIP